MKTPEFPPPDPRDPPEVATSLRNAAALWAKGRHKDALQHLMRAAASAQSSSKSGAPKSDLRVVQLAMAATELAAFVHGGDDPRSIPISIDFDAGAVDVESLNASALESVDSTDDAAEVAKIVKGRVHPEPEVARADLGTTLPQGYKLPGVPADWPFGKKKQASAPQPPKKAAAKTPEEAPSPEPPAVDPMEDDPHGAPTRRMEDIDTKRDPGHGKR